MKTFLTGIAVILFIIGVMWLAVSAGNSAAERNCHFILVGRVPVERCE